MGSFLGPRIFKLTRGQKLGQVEGFCRDQPSPLCIAFELTVHPGFLWWDFPAWPDFLSPIAQNGPSHPCLKCPSIDLSPPNFDLKALCAGNLLLAKFAVPESENPSGRTTANENFPGWKGP